MARKAKKTEGRSAAEIAFEMLKVKEDLKPLEAAYKVLSKELLDQMKAEHKRDEGVFHIRTRQSLVVADEALAAGFADEYNLFKIDTSKAADVLRRNYTAPEAVGFRIKETEYIGIGAEREDSDLGVIIT